MTNWGYSLRSSEQMYRFRGQGRVPMMAYKVQGQGHVMSPNTVITLGIG